MPLPLYLIFFLILCIPQSSLAENVQLQIEGLSGSLEKNIKARLSGINTDKMTADSQLSALIERNIRQGLRALGYYDAVIDFLYQKTIIPERSLLIVRITAGEPVRIADVSVVLRGDAEHDNDYHNLSGTIPASGSILHHGHFDDFKHALRSLAIRKGYFDAEIIKSQLNVAPQLHKAFWNIEFNSGKRYRFGKVSFQGAQIREDYLYPLIPFHEGEYYNSDRLIKFNNQLTATHWFNSVAVSPDFAEAKKSKILSMQATVTPRARNTVELGGGYASDTGPHIKANWKKPWMNSRGHSLTTSAEVSTLEQSLDINYQIPLLKNPLEHYYLLQGGFKHSNLNDTKSDTTTLNAVRFWDSSSGWRQSINLRWSLDHYTQASITDTTLLLYPGININRIRQQDSVMPAWGDSQQYSLEVSNTLWRSQVDFLITKAQNVWIHTLGEKNRFVIRGNIGWIDTNNFERLPPSLRFFVGGDRSIRGYKYKSISPKNSEGKLTGASKMLTGSFEYQYNIKDKWWSAAFIDSGEAVNDIRESDFKTGTGIGIRWASPVGLMKFDIAAPVNAINVKKVNFYIGLGTEL